MIITIKSSKISMYIVLWNYYDPFIDEVITPTWRAMIFGKIYGNSRYNRNGELK